MMSAISVSLPIESRIVPIESHAIGILHIITIPNRIPVFNLILMRNPHHQMQNLLKHRQCSLIQVSVIHFYLELFSFCKKKMLLVSMFFFNYMLTVLFIFFFRFHSYMLALHSLTKRIHYKVHNFNFSACFAFSHQTISLECIFVSNFIKCCFHSFCYFHTCCVLFLAYIMILKLNTVWLSVECSLSTVHV